MNVRGEFSQSSGSDNIRALSSATYQRVWTAHIHLHIPAQSYLSCNICMDWQYPAVRLYLNPDLKSTGSNLLVVAMQHPLFA